VKLHLRQLNAQWCFVLREIPPFDYVMRIALRLGEILILAWVERDLFKRFQKMTDFKPGGIENFISSGCKKRGV
jgi:hypothetical protein